MKQPLLLFTALLLATASFAQLPDGSIAPDFTATDINGIEHNLYDILDEGKAVILQFSATWCGPCWSYHTGGALEELNADYGPSGTDELRIFFIEADDTTTDEDLNGSGPSTQGDWVTGTSYPIIDNGGAIFGEYAGAYYPTIYTVCPNRILTESGQASSVDHASIFQANDCAAASLPNDPALLGYTGGTTACPGEPVNMSVDLMNLGVTNLQYCTIAVMDGSTEVLSYDWSGDLSTYGIANVDLGTAVFDASTSFTIEITSSDDNDVNNSSSGAVELAEESAMLVKVEIQTDNWPGEISWNISDDEGNVIESVAAGELTVPEEVVVWWVSIPEEGCYSFTLGDIYSDGMFAEQWGDFVNGSCEVTSWHDENNLASVIYNYDGSYGYESEQAGLAASNLPFTVSGCTDALACNYNLSAEEEDGSCTYPGCTDPSAVNYDSSAGCEAECLYLEYTCGFIGNDGWEDLETAAYPEWQEAVHGVAWSGEWVLNIAAEMEEPSTGVPYPLHHFEWTDFSGIPTWAEDVTFELGTVGPNEQRCISASGVPVLPGMHEIQVEGELFISIFGQPFSIGIQSYSAWLEVLDNPNPIPGCTYANAVNFLSYATDDDGSCLFGGCTDEAANNFNPIATIDDGSCGEECEPGVDSSCSTDANNDGTVSVADLLILLGEFGTTCE